MTTKGDGMSPRVYLDAVILNFHINRRDCLKIALVSHVSRNCLIMKINREVST